MRLKKPQTLSPRTLSSIRQLLAQRASVTFMVAIAALVTAVIPGSGAASGEPLAPPGPIAVVSSSTTSIDLSWGPSSDHLRVVGYSVFLNGKFRAHVTQRSYRISGLACGTTYTVSVAAFDSAQTLSPQTSAVVATSPCLVGAPPAPSAPPAPPVPSAPSSDVKPPSKPSGLSISSVKADALTLNWKASTDNVGVVSYDVYVGNAKAGTAPSNSFTASGLACGTSYVLGVEARDAAGNRSARATVSTVTSACGDAGIASLFVASNGSDAGSCAEAAPCASFARAFALAAPGAVVEVAGGSYPVQTLKDVSKSAGAAVVFRPGAGASVTLAEFVSGDTKLKVGAKRFELRDMKISSYVRVRWGSEDVTLRNLDAGGLNLTSASRVQVLGGDYGPMVNGVSHINACGVPGCYPAQDILIEGAYFHDYTITYAEKHSECLMIWPGRRVTIRNSTFRNCTDFDLLVKPYKTSLVGLPGEITLENNLFDEPIIGEGCFCNRGGNAIAMTQGAGKESWNGVQIRYNSSLGGIRVDPMISNATIKGNIARKDTNYSCQKNISFAYNIWTGATCSPTDRKAPFADIFVGPTSATFDLSLKPGSLAIAAGDPNEKPNAGAM